MKINLGYLALAWAFILLFQVWVGSGKVKELSYSEFRQRLAAGDISNVVIAPNQLNGEFLSPIDGRTAFVVQRVDQDLADELDQYKVQYAAKLQLPWLDSLISWLAPALVFFAIWMLLIRRMTARSGVGGFMNVGKSNARVHMQKHTDVTFDDVAGADEAKAELQEVVSFLTNRKRYSRLGAHVPKGILLVGPPGCGKTLLARAVAGQAGVPFFSISGSEFVEMFVGVGAARVRDLFEQAGKVAPCIIFIDELDSLGKSRAALSVGGSDEKEQTLNQLLAELDGFDPNEGIVLLAATNRPEILDPALLRAGRFDRRIVVDLPDRRGREAILNVHLSRITQAQDLNVGEIAAMTPGFSGADLANLANEAAIFATRREANAVSLEDFTAAIERIVAGAERPGRLMNPIERQRVATHEIGHALVAAKLPGAEPVRKVSIIPRSIGALGYTMQLPTEDRYVITKAEIEDRMTVLMAGRAAESMVYGSYSSGAADDLAKVTDMARHMVTSLGMEASIGQAVLERESSSYLTDHQIAVRQKDYSEQTAREIDLAVRALIERAYQRAESLLNEHEATLHDGVTLLLEKETLTPDDFPALRQSAGDDTTVAQLANHDAENTAPQK